METDPRQRAELQQFRAELKRRRAEIDKQWAEIEKQQDELLDWCVSELDRIAKLNDDPTSA